MNNPIPHPNITKRVANNIKCSGLNMNTLKPYNTAPKVDKITNPKKPLISPSKHSDIISSEFLTGEEKRLALKIARDSLKRFLFEGDRSRNQEYFQKYDIAIDYYTRAIELSPLYYTAIYNRGLCFEKLGDLKNAENDFRKTLKIKSDYDYAALALERVLKGK